MDTTLGPETGWALQRGSIGFYSNGRLESVSRISGEEGGLLKLFVERNRGYGNRALVDLLTGLGSEYRQAWPQPYERIQVGDLSRYGGGKISKHVSHQNGLDADIAYLRRDFRETDPARGFDASFDEEFVRDGAVMANFDGPRNWWVFRYLFRSGRVARIFTDAAIKKHYCAHAREFEPADVAARDEVLRLLSPIPEHTDHFHVRLQCPATDTLCEPSPALPPGTGC